MMWWIILGSIGYIIGAIVVARIEYNIDFSNQVEKYRREFLKDSKTYPLTYGHYAKMSEDELFEKAYNKAKEYDFDVSPAVFMGSIWPVTLVGMGLIGLSKGIYFVLSKMMPDTSADKRMKQIELKRQRKQEWDNALNAMKEAGIDTTELRKMEID